MPINCHSFSNNLTRVRKEKGLSQRELSKMSGISQRMIAHYEKHVSYPPIDKVEMLANTLKVDAAELLGLKSVNYEINDEFDVRTIKRFRKLLNLNAYDRSAVYKMIDLLLQKPEYKESASK